jgi:serine/threonine-protein kinase
MATDAEVESVSTDDAGDPQKLKRLGKYVIQRRLGAGGMGAVFLAVDSELQRTVALKVLPRERAANPKLVQRFKSEGQSAARLEHGNIVKVYEAGEIGGYLYIALEYVDGTDVDALIRKRTFLPVKRSIDIIRQVALALEHADEKGIVHRDIKPSNLMIRKDGMVKLADMGLARAIDDTADTGITQPGMTVGTVDYMAPEQGRDSKLADIRSDIYSLGCTWYHMLTGSPPFPEGSVTAKMAAHATNPPPNPRTINRNVPEAVVAVIHRMMAKDPRDRYQTPQELLADLKQTMLGRQSVDADVLAGLAAAESDWERPVHTDLERATTAGGTSKTTSDRATPEKERTPRKSKRKQTKRTQANGQSQPRTPSQKKPPRQTDSKRRELPPRSENPEKLGTSQKPLDLERLKILVFIFIGVCVVGGVGYAISLWSSSNDFGDAGTLNPDRPGVEQSGPQPTLVGDPPVTVRDPAPTGTPRDQEDEDNTPSTQVNEFRNVELFSGAERGEDVPQWLIEARKGLAGDLSTLVVSPDEDGSADHTTIADALDSLPAAGGIIELDGRGPFPLPPRAIENHANVVIRARSKTRPVVVLQSAGPAPVDEWLSFRGKGLEISGVHLFAAGRRLAAGAPAIHVASGSLLMRNSSLTVADAAPQPVTGIQLGERDSSGANALLENTILRGPRLTAVRVASTAVNVVSGNSLIASGNAPAIVILPEDFANRSDAETRDLVTASLFATAVSSRSAAFELALQDPERPPRVELGVHRTVFAAGSPHAVCLRFDNWPEDDSGDLATPLARGLTWTGKEFSLLGWSSLVQFQSPQRSEPLRIQDDDAWRRFWSTSTESRSFVAGEFNPQSIATEQVPPEQLTDRIQTFLADAGSGGGTFGLDAGGLPSLPESLIDRLRAGSERPSLPAEFAVTSERSVEFDLSQGARLNEFLNSSRCPDHAVVHLTGEGRQIRPIVLRNKSLQLVFPAGEDEVILRPIPTPGSERPAAFIQVEGGSIDLVNARLTIPSSARAGYPERVLQVIDGDFTLHGCIFIGQFRDGAQDVPAIEWTRADGDAQQFAFIRNSLVAGRFQSVSADLSHRLLECENSVFTTLGAAFDLFTEGPAASGWAALSNCTISAGRTAFLARTDSAASPVNCFVRRSVFAPPPESSAAGCVVLTYPTAVESIVWWSSYNGFAPQYRRFHQAVDAPSTGDQNIDRDWVRFWGGEHVWYPLTGPTAVLLADQLPEPDRVEPADYALSESSEARTWGPGGVPIGARVDEIGPGRLADDEQSRTPPTRQPTRNDPGF